MISSSVTSNQAVALFELHVPNENKVIIPLGYHQGPLRQWTRKNYFNKLLSPAPLESPGNRNLLTPPLKAISAWRGTHKPEEGSAGQEYMWQSSIVDQSRHAELPWPVAALLPIWLCFSPVIRMLLCSTPCLSLGPCDSLLNLASVGGSIQAPPLSILMLSGIKSEGSGKLWVPLCLKVQWGERTKEEELSNMV